MIMDGTGSGGEIKQRSMTEKALPAHSKATTLVKRKTSEMEDEEMMQYTDSNAEAGTHYFQLEGTAGSGNLEMLRRKKTENLISKTKDIVQEEDERVHTSGAV